MRVLSIACLFEYINSTDRLKKSGEERERERVKERDSERTRKRERQRQRESI